VLSLYDARSGRAEEITTARPGVVRVSCAGELRAQLVADLVRRVAGHHRLRAIGVWEPVPDGEPADQVADHLGAQLFGAGDPDDSGASRDDLRKAPGSGIVQAQHADDPTHKSAGRTAAP